jgi:membrane protease YdiL (CAAX protease family)
MPAFLRKAKYYTSLLTGGVLLLLLLLLVVSSADVCDGFSTLHHQPHQVKHFSRPQFRVPSVAVLSPSSVINTVNGPHRMSASTTSNEEGGGHQNKMADNINKTWSSDFWFGATYVHNHYLEIYWGLAEVHAPLVLLSIILYVVVIRFAFLPSIAEQTRLALVRVLSMFGALSNKLMDFPLLIAGESLSFLAIMSIHAAMAIKKKDNPIQAVWLALRKIAKGEIGLVQACEKASYLDVSEAWYTGLIGLLVIAPLLEEILCRRLFDRVWHGSARLINRLKRYISKSSTTHGSEEKNIETTKNMANELSIPHRLWFGYEPWIIVSSLIFAASHLANWLPIHESEDRVRSMFIQRFGAERLKSDPKLWMYYRDFTPIFAALLQTAGAGFLSLRVLSPLYQQRGLAASIGAHFAWNLNTLFLLIQLPARIFVRSVKSFRNWVRPRYEKPPSQ